uniref:Uncharacterized protein n=1 Tax=Saimiriine herpesvirus 1 (strain MV-5-4-PSL) TaxID=10353 RepID=Q69405_SHV1|nr:unknown protein [Saimiriine alphaherpesvirus 1]
MLRSHVSLPGRPGMLLRLWVACTVVLAEEADTPPHPLPYDAERHLWTPSLARPGEVSGGGLDPRFSEPS